MIQKTFKIGEYAKGGIIAVKIEKPNITIISKEWDFSSGSSRGSNQSNARELSRLKTNVNDSNAKQQLRNFLFSLTTPYYSDKILDWIKTKITFKEGYERW